MVTKKNNKKIVIIGGVAGGASCAARLRRLDDTAEIVLLERGDYISYANCGLPYHVGDVIKQRSALLVSTPEMMRNRFNIDVRTGNEATAIDRKNKTVKIKDKTGREYEESYDNLVISTGSSPLRPGIPGIDSELIRTLWTIPDTDNIRKMALESGYTSAAVIGGGFIGLEVAENLHLAGLKVTIIEGSNQVMPPVDFEMAQMIHENIEDNGVELILSDPVSSFEEIEENGGKKIKILTDSGKTVTADFVVLSIGLRPNNSLAVDAGIETGERGGIKVNEYMVTSDKNIYAVGDAAEITDFTTGERIQYQLAGPANKQGRIAANNIYGAKEAYDGTQATSIAKIFDYALGMTGKSEKALVNRGLVRGKDFEKIYITQNQHAGYYPGAVPLTIKLLFAPDGSKIFGAQIVGRDGVDKRIDTISVASRLDAKATDLAKLEMAYAPPYSSAKDPVNMLGFTVRNMLDGLIKFADWDVDLNSEDLQVLDIRVDAERLAFELPSAIGLSLDDLRGRMDDLDKNKTTVILCSIGVRSYTAARMLMSNGFKDVQVYPAGTRFYQAIHYKELQEERGTVLEAPEQVSQSEPAQTQAAAMNKVRIDCSGMQCPGPILKVYETMKDMQDGDELEVSASDPGFTKDVAAWCRRTGNTLVSNEKRGFDYVAHIKKGAAPQNGDKAAGNAGVPAATAGGAPAQANDGKTIVVFSGDMDKVMASFIIANGAAAMGKPVTMFFTFWGLSVLRKKPDKKIHKSKMESMFGTMLPTGSEDLKISKMNMGGLGTKMMKKIMKDKNVDSLEDLIKKAMQNGVKIVACTMSMDVMGIKPEELIDGVELGGVGYYLGDAEESNINLFI